jgi:hypothetical protein
MRFRSALITLVTLITLAAGSPAHAVEPPYNPVPRDEKYLQEDLARLAKDPHNPVLMREAAMSYNILGSPENYAYLNKAKTLLEESNKLRPNDAYTLMFLGSTIGLLARDPDVGILSKTSMVNEALELMDRAVKLEPASLRLRLMRATSSIAVPSVFGRGKVLEEDVAFVRRTLEPQPPKEVPKHTVAAGYLLLGAYHEKVGELPRARVYWQQAIVTGKGTRFEEQAKKKLAQNAGK